MDSLPRAVTSRIPCKAAAPGGTGAGDVRPCRIAAAAACVLAAWLLLALPSPSRADIYRWKDAQGTVHFTDDVASIPARYRAHSTVVIRTAPSGAARPAPSAQPPAPSVTPRAAPSTGQDEAEEAANETERQKQDLVSQIEQLKAKIAAKEEHVRTIDAKRSLAVNPLRNRFVDPADLALYRKYKAELPGDRERLGKLEALLDSLK